VNSILRWTRSSVQHDFHSRLRSNRPLDQDECHSRFRWTRSLVPDECHCNLIRVYSIERTFQLVFSLLNLFHVSLQREVVDENYSLQCSHWFRFIFEMVYFIIVNKYTNNIIMSF